MDYRGKRIIITGGSTGIGLEMARELSRRGARLGLIARTPEALEAAAAICREAGGEAHWASADVTDAAALGDALAALVDTLGGLDGIVANSGYCHPGNFHDISIEDGARQLDTNLKGCVHTVRLALPRLLEHGGFVAITSSPAGNAAIYGFSLYGATKAALNSLAHALHHEYADRGIRIHLLLPPDSDTPGYAKETLLYPPETKAILSGGALLQPDHVAMRFVDGIARGQRQIAVGFETHLLLRMIRHTPWLWEWYSRRQIRRARRG
ncbi:MAG: SDR family NAD(P)-dependent oxidoreductase [Candidatus Hydrogenedens sp.]|nr:SDR family NAD(P)-dependent oxidoreductase [Candidatus Hydrogenedens sp.]